MSTVDVPSRFWVIEARSGERTVPGADAPWRELARFPLAQGESPDARMRDEWQSPPAPLREGDLVRTLAGDAAAVVAFGRVNAHGQVEEARPLRDLPWRVESQPLALLRGEDWEVLEHPDMRGEWLFAALQRQIPAHRLGPLLLTFARRALSFIKNPEERPHRVLTALERWWLAPNPERAFALREAAAAALAFDTRLAERNASQSPAGYASRAVVDTVRALFQQPELLWALAPTILLNLLAAGEVHALNFAVRDESRAGGPPDVDALRARARAGRGELDRWASARFWEAFTLSEILAYMPAPRAGGDAADPLSSVA